MRQIFIDGSSTTLGWVLAEDGQRRFSGTQKLTGKTIEARVEQAYIFAYDLISGWRGVEVVVTEAPGGRFMKGVLPQVRVNGVVILACRQKGVAWREVSATEGKKALTGSGRAEKRDMLIKAAPHLGYDPDSLFYSKRSGLWLAQLDGQVVFDENEADAVGVMLAFGTRVDTPNT